MAGALGTRLDDEEVAPAAAVDEEEAPATAADEDDEDCTGCEEEVTALAVGRLAAAAAAAALARFSCRFPHMCSFQVA